MLNLVWSFQICVRIRQNTKNTFWNQRKNGSVPNLSFMPLMPPIVGQNGSKWAVFCVDIVESIELAQPLSTSGMITFKRLGWSFPVEVIHEIMWLCLKMGMPIELPLKWGKWSDQPSKNAMLWQFEAFFGDTLGKHTQVVERVVRFHRCPRYKIKLGEIHRNSIVSYQFFCCHTESYQNHTWRLNYAIGPPALPVLEEVASWVTCFLRLQNSTG